MSNVICPCMVMIDNSFRLQSQEPLNCMIIRICSATQRQRCAWRTFCARSPAWQRHTHSKLCLSILEWGLGTLSPTRLLPARVVVCFQVLSLSLVTQILHARNTMGELSNTLWFVPNGPRLHNLRTRGVRILLCAHLFGAAYLWNGSVELNFVLSISNNCLILS